MHLRFYNIWDCVIFSFILPRGYYDELNQCKCIYPRWQWHHQSPAGVHDDQCRVKDLLEESQCRQSSTWSTWDNSQNWRKLFKTRLVTRVFRFTSKLEFLLYTVVQYSPTVFPMNSSCLDFANDCLIISVFWQSGAGEEVDHQQSSTE